LSEWDAFLRLLAATASGALVGFERELHDKPAGFRTNILICVGACLFTLLSILMVGDQFSDRTRVAAQIVTGVGFLGAGAIVQFKGNVLGLTTAATIWVVASIGMAYGAGEVALGTIVTLLVTAVLFGLSYAEQSIATWRTTAKFKLRVQPSLSAADELRQKIEASGVQMRGWMITKFEQGFTVRISISGPRRELEKLQAQLIADPRVLSLRRV
jgi:putative Mg2+ transporter-C (MgtC) family protein